jgi:hypothetical protein
MGAGLLVVRTGKEPPDDRRHAEAAERVARDELRAHPFRVAGSPSKATGRMTCVLIATRSTRPRAASRRRTNTGSLNVSETEPSVVCDR